MVVLVDVQQKIMHTVWRNWVQIMSGMKIIAQTKLTDIVFVTGMKPMARVIQAEKIIAKMNMVKIIILMALVVCFIPTKKYVKAAVDSGTREKLIVMKVAMHIVKANMAAIMSGPG